jgi:hypothetical protein
VHLKIESEYGSVHQVQVLPHTHNPGASVSRYVNLVKFTNQHPKSVSCALHFTH